MSSATLVASVVVALLGAVGGALPGARHFSDIARDAGITFRHAASKTPVTALRSTTG